MHSTPLERSESTVCAEVLDDCPQMRPGGGYYWTLPMIINCFRVLKVAAKSTYGTDSTEFPAVHHLQDFMDDLDHLRRNPQDEILLLHDRNERFGAVISEEMSATAFIGKTKTTKDAVYAHYSTNGGSHIQYWIDCDAMSKSPSQSTQVRSSDVISSRCEPSKWMEYMAKKAMLELGSRAMDCNHIAAVLNAQHILSVAEKVAPGWLISLSDPQIYQYFDFGDRAKKIHGANDILVEELRQMYVEVHTNTFEFPVFVILQKESSNFVEA